MFQKLVSHNDDIRRLVEKGYAIAFDSNYMVIRDIPYLDANKGLQVGGIVAKLVFIDQEKVTQDDHQVFFAGGAPCDIDGKPIRNIGADRASRLSLGADCSDVVVQRQFSSKPKAAGKFADFFEKIESYTTIISGPAMYLHGATPYTFKTVKTTNTNPVFKFHDTLTSRAEIADLAAKFENDVIAIIGLGGTGAYLLDFLSKTPVKEIRGFDLDPFHVHNTFRSPGKLDISELGKSKAEVYLSRYGNFRAGLSLQAKHIDASCAEDLEGVNFAFVCVDKGSSRAEIFDLLISLKIPFIDVGMGLHRKEEGPLRGQLRTTYYSAGDGESLRQKDLAQLTEGQDDLYKTNIQIGELNAINACLAVLRFKQLRGFYSSEDSSLNHIIFTVDDCRITGESFTNGN